MSILATQVLLVLTFLCGFYCNLNFRVYYFGFPKGSRIKGYQLQSSESSRSLVEAMKSNAAESLLLNDALVRQGASALRFMAVKENEPNPGTD